MSSIKFGHSQPWLFTTFPWNIKFQPISELIKNTLFEFGIYCSRVYISNYPKLIVVHLVYFSPTIKIDIVKDYLNSLLVLLLNKNIYLNIKRTHRLLNDDHYISTWFKHMIEEEPSSLRFDTKQFLEKQEVKQINKIWPVPKRIKLVIKNNDFLNRKSNYFYKNPRCWLK